MGRYLWFESWYRADCSTFTGSCRTPFSNFCTPLSYFLPPSKTLFWISFDLSLERKSYFFFCFSRKFIVAFLGHTFKLLHKFPICIVETRANNNGWLTLIRSEQNWLLTHETRSVRSVRPYNIHCWSTKMFLADLYVNLLIISPGY